MSPRTPWGRHLAAARHSCAALTKSVVPSSTALGCVSRLARMQSRIACLPQTALKAAWSAFFEAAHSFAAALEPWLPLFG